VLVIKCIYTKKNTAPSEGTEPRACGLYGRCLRLFATSGQPESSYFQPSSPAHSTPEFPCRNQCQVQIQQDTASW
jgi:hypothetical protein